MLYGISFFIVQKIKIKKLKTNTNQEEIKVVLIKTILNQIMIQIIIQIIIQTNNPQMIIHTENQKVNQRKTRLKQNVSIQD